MSSYTGRFSQKAEDYNRYRPKYPAELLELLVTDLQLSPEKVVADIGSGTGISSEIFIENGNRVFAVEPNASMREMAEQNLGDRECFISIDGSAEDTGLMDSAVDLIFSGTAFHWFDFERTKKEFKRILKPGGYAVISWISRDMSGPLQQDTEAVFSHYTEDITSVEKQKDADKVEEFFSPNQVSHKDFPHSQTFNWEEFLGRVRSSSYYPSADDEKYNSMTAKMKAVFEKYEQDGTVEFRYKTEVYRGNLV